MTIVLHSRSQSRSPGILTRFCAALFVAHSLLVGCVDSDSADLDAAEDLRRSLVDDIDQGSDSDPESNTDPRSNKAQRTAAVPVAEPGSKGYQDIRFMPISAHRQIRVEDELDPERPGAGRDVAEGTGPADVTEKEFVKAVSFHFDFPGTLRLRLELELPIEKLVGSYPAYRHPATFFLDIDSNQGTGETIANGREGFEVRLEPTIGFLSASTGEWDWAEGPAVDGGGPKASDFACGYSLEWLVRPPDSQFSWKAGDHETMIRTQCSSDVFEITVPLGWFGIKTPRDPKTATHLEVAFSEFDRWAIHFATQVSESTTTQKGRFVQDVILLP